MDIGDTPEEAAFRAEAHAFLARHARRRAPGEETVGFLADTDPDVETAHIAEAKAWQAPCTGRAGPASPGRRRTVAGAAPWSRR